MAGLALHPAEATTGVTRTGVAHPRPDMDCGDFGTQAAAQRYFINRGGPQSDPDNLDSDGDGIACESNPCPCSTSQGGGGGGQPPADRTSFGAISLNVKGRAGTSTGSRTKDAAFKQAVRDCNRGASARYKCVRVGYAKNECAAVWFKLDNHGNVVSAGADRARFATGKTKVRAARNARHGHRGGHVVKTCA